MAYEPQRIQAPRASCSIAVTSCTRPRARRPSGSCRTWGRARARRSCLVHQDAAVDLRLLARLGVVEAEQQCLLGPVVRPDGRGQVVEQKLALGHLVLVRPDVRWLQPEGLLEGQRHLDGDTLLGAQRFLYGGPLPTAPRCLVDTFYQGPTSELRRLQGFSELAPHG